MVKFVDWANELDNKPLATLSTTLYPDTLSINERTITLLTGPSMVGKTALSLNFANSAIKEGHNVVFMDTEGKPLTSRTEPNLLKILSQGSLESWKSKFSYIMTTDVEVFTIACKEADAKLLIIDSLYNAFCRDKKQNPKSRAKDIKYFMMRLKDFVYKEKIAAIVTSPIGTSGDSKDKVLGGDAIKQYADHKFNIQFNNTASEISGIRTSRGKARLIVADAIRNYQVVFGDGGVIE